MDCSEFERNISSFVRGTLKGNTLRRTYYHLTECKECKEVLLDEFSFYVIINDLDRDLSFNYRDRLDKMMTKIGNDIKAYDSKKIKKYTWISLLICFIFVLLLVIAIRIVYV